MSNPDADKIFEQFGDLFGDMFGQATGKRGGDRRVELELSYVEARDGTRRDVTFKRGRPCDACKDTARVACSTCSGRGQQMHTQGFFTVQTVCPSCRGRGQILASTCAACTSGVAEREETVTVVVPAGVQPGQVLRLQGKGDEHASGVAGHLFVSLKIDTENIVRRDGEQATVEVPVPLATVLFGGKLRVPTPDGVETIRLRRGSYDGEIITLRGQGFARAGGTDPYRGTERGDHKIVLRVSHEVRKQRDMLRYTAATILIIALMIAFSRLTR